MRSMSYYIKENMTICLTGVELLFKNENYCRLKKDGRLFCHPTVGNISYYFIS